MCKDQSFFEDYKLLEGNRMVQLGDGAKVKVWGEGNIFLNAYNGSKWSLVQLQNVLHVPDLKVNLFSVISALDRNLKMVSDNNMCKFVKNNNIVAIAKREDRMFKMCFDKTQGKPEEKLDLALTGVTSNSSGNYCQNNCDLYEFHKKFAHQHFTHVKSVLSQNNINVSCMKNHFCVACLEGKQCRKSHSASTTKTKSIGELIHADLCGPLEEVSLGGSKYFLLLKDDFSHYRTVFFLREKNQVFSKLKIFLAKIKNQGIIVKTIRTDNGSEFVNKDVKNLFNEYGIVHQTTVAYTPAQNGKVEREMRTVMEAARTMLKEKHFPKCLWAEAVNMAVFVLNRTGTSSVLKRTPFTLWHKKSFNVKLLKAAFGTEVWTHVPKQKRTKLDSKSQKGFFVGYSETTKGYRIFYPDKNNCSVECDVFFAPESTSVVSDETANQKGAKESLQSFETLSDYDDSFPEENGGSQIEDFQENETLDGNTDNENMKEAHNESSLEIPTTTTTEILNTRPARQTRIPRRLTEDYYCYLAFGEDEPATLEEALSSPQVTRWCEAMQIEKTALTENNTWMFVDKPKKDVLVVNTKWVFKIKQDENGKNSLFKARLVARGFVQQGLDYKEIYSPVVKMATVKTLTALSNKQKWPFFHLDVCSAFLNGVIKDEIYITLPNNFDVPKNKYCKLQKALYGLKNAPKCWYERLNDFLLNEKFTKSISDQCLYYFISNVSRVYLLVFVDDILYTGYGSTLTLINDKLKNKFKMKDLGLAKFYLGISIGQDLQNGITTLDQTQYLNKVLKKFNMSECHAVTTPMDPNYNLSLLLRDKSESEEIETRCRQLIGCIMYAMLGTRPDLCSSITFLSRFQTCASSDLWVCLKRLLRYIKGTVDLKLTYKSDKTDNILTGYADADWGSNAIDRKSTSGYCFQVYGNLVLWISKKQPTVSLSSCEAEYIALSSCISEACWLQNLILELKIHDVFSVIIYEDNQSTIKSCNSHEQLKRMKHLDIKYHFVKEKISKGYVVIEYVNTRDQLADILTKPLPRISFEKFRCLMGLTN